MNPDRGFECGLKQARPVVAALDVSVLVNQNLIQLAKAHHVEETRREHDIWLMQSEDGGVRNAVADHQLYRASAVFDFLPQRQLFFNRRNNR
mgnify:CR=1 FL=1